MQIIISIGHNNIITGIPAGKSSNVNTSNINSVQQNAFMNNVRTKQDKIKRNVLFVNANPENDTLNRNTSNTVAKRIVPGNELLKHDHYTTLKSCVLSVIRPANA